MYCILLVEDDTALRTGLTELFTREGYTVMPAANATEARQILSANINLIVLDVTLPDGNGVTLCREWRNQGIDTPILFLTAKDEEFDIVRGLDAGGNDYVTKPFRMMELLSRIRALLRRNIPAPVTTSGELEIDQAHMQVRRGGEIIPLTLTEYKVLNMLVSSRSIVTREQLLDILWDDGAKFVDDNTLSVHISRLREKIGAQHIKTIRGVGYQWLA
ncbi:MAG: response regulator transcription factor [Oscillospiraceae bacterium]|nr:response regulator transcription factor [Clostridia bacterium]MBQ9167464.1 response regulator transcription factor [Oscillospiraceae bacterium]